MKNKGIIVFDIPSEKDNIKVNPVIMPTIVEAYAFPTLITGKIMSVYMSLLYFLDIYAADKSKCQRRNRRCYYKHCCKRMRGHMFFNDSFYLLSIFITKEIERYQYNQTKKKEK